MNFPEDEKCRKTNVNESCFQTTPSINVHNSVKLKLDPVAYPTAILDPNTPKHPESVTVNRLRIAVLFEKQSPFKTIKGGSAVPH